MTGTSPGHDDMVLRRWAFACLNIFLAGPVESAATLSS
jgi:hypothetical protein